MTTDEFRTKIETGAHVFVDYDFCIIHKDYNDIPGYHVETLFRTQSIVNDLNNHFGTSFAVNVKYIISKDRYKEIDTYLRSTKKYIGLIHDKYDHEEKNRKVRWP